MSRPPVEIREFDLLELLQVLWRGRWTILLVTLLCAAAGTAYVLLAPKWYRADIVLVQSEQGSLPRELGQLGGLASLAGINLGAAGGDSQMPLAVLKSREFAREFIESNNLIPVLLAHRMGSRKKPDIRDAVQYFDDEVRVVGQDTKTGLITLSITWKDAALSAVWANELAQRANNRLRDQALAKSERNVRYLQTEITSTSVTSMQQSIGRVLESEMQKMMLARGNDEYAFKVVDKAFEPKKPAVPNKLVIIVASVLLGLLISIVSLIVRNSLRARAGAR